MLKVSVFNEVAWLCPIPTVVYKPLLTHMLSPYVPVADAFSLHLYIVRDARISALNMAHMHCFGPTNVLSFPAQQHMQNKQAPTAVTAQYCPDILALSVDTLQRECLLYGQETLEHTVRLLAHGLGHILGYDHGEEMFALCTEMEQLGQEFLAQI